jgi:hypothetical protein
VNKGDIKIDGIGTNDQLVDIFTKPLDENWFCKLRNELNVFDCQTRGHGAVYIKESVLG